MDLKAIYAKTPKGVEEIGTRANRLSPKLRSLLIMVNGKVGAAEFVARSGAMAAGVEILLEQLLEQGYIAPLAAGAGEPERSPMFIARRGAVSRLVLDTLGPDGEMLALRIERADTPAELDELCVQAREVVGGLAGGRKAEMFRARLDAIMTG